MAVDKSYIKIKTDSNGQQYECISEKDPGIIVNCCPFCDTRTRSGSWTPDHCPNCGAVNFFTNWTRDIP